MSPRMQFRGPARQRGAIGLMAALTLGLAVGFTVLVVDSGRLYLEQRKLQRVADTAALEAVTRNGDCLPGLSAATYATQSAARNGFTVNADGTLTTTCGTLNTGADNFRAFTVDSTKSAAVRVVATHNVATSVAAGVYALLSGGPVSLTTAIERHGRGRQTAADGGATEYSQHAGELIPPSRTSQPAVLRAAGRQRQPTALRLGWPAEDRHQPAEVTWINWRSTSTSRPVTTPSCSTPRPRVTQLIQAAATVVQLNGATAQVITALGQSAGGGDQRGSPVKLGDMLQLQTGTTAAGLDANLQLLQLIQGVVQLANKQECRGGDVAGQCAGAGEMSTVDQGHRTAAVFRDRRPGLGESGAAGREPDLCAHGAGRAILVIRWSWTLTNTVLGLSTRCCSLVVAVWSDTLRLRAAFWGPAPRPTCKYCLSPLNLDIDSEAGGGKSYVTDYSCASPTNKSLTATTNISVLPPQSGQDRSDNLAVFFPLAQPFAIDPGGYRLEILQLA